MTAVLVGAALLARLAAMPRWQAVGTRGGRMPGGGARRLLSGGAPGC